MKRVILYILFLLFSLNLTAQVVYPIRSYTILQPPLPYNLNGFVSEPGKINLNIIVDDVDLDQYAVKFRLHIEGNGIKLTTRTDFFQQAYYLEGAGTYTLTGFDLEDLLNPDNLIFEGYSRNQYKKTGRLPEGVYRIWVDLYDYYRNVKVSMSSPGIAMIFFAKAPRLSFPLNETEIDSYQMQNIRFSWFSILPADPLADVRYRFKLFEIRPDGRDPYEITRVMQPVYQEETNQSSFVYDASMPPLISGMSYAWKVEAYDLENRVLFQNDGHSDVLSFRYGKSCVIPELTIDEVKSRTVSLHWITDAATTEYTLAYKRTKDETWQEETTDLVKYTLNDLDDNSGYQIKIKARCADSETGFSRIQELKTTREVNYACGNKSDKFDLSNTEPLPSLGRFDEFKAADFIVEVEEVTGGNGNFTGKGYALVPYLGFLKFRVEFENIFVNSDSRMTSGEIKFVYDKTTGMIVGENSGDVADDDDDTVNVKDELDEISDKVIESDTDVTSVEVVGDNVVITHTDGTSETVSVGDNKVISVTGGDSDSGNAYVVDAGSGQVFTTPKKVAGGGKGSSSVGTASQTGEYGCSVSFLKATTQRYGFDQIGDGKTKPDSYFLKSKTGDLLNWKSLESGSTDFVNINVDGTCSLDSLRYLRESGLLTPSAPNKKGRQLLLTGLSEGEEDILSVAVAKTKMGSDSSSREILTLAGALGLVTYDRITRNVVLVPVNGAQCPDNFGFLSQELNEIYAPAVVSWNVSVEKNLEVDKIKGKVFEHSGTDILSKYTSDMRTVINEFKRERDHDRHTVYLFFISERTATKTGFMPLASEYGFIFNFGTDTHVLAHELGHSKDFNLRHTFSDKAQHYFPERSTQNLMDYAGGSELWKYQWDLLHNPEKILFAWGQDEEEGAYEEGEIAQKILQELCCAYLNGVADFKSEYLGRLPVRDKVMLSGTSFDICLEYEEEKEISLTEAIEIKQGNFDKGSVWNDPLKDLPQDFKYKYRLGGLIIYTNTEGFEAKLKPTEESVNSDFDKVWLEIDIEDGISKEEFKKLKSIAACASKYLTANQRYNLLAALVPNNNNIIESREDLILDLFETSTYREDLNEFVGLLKEDTKLFEKLFTQIDDITYDFWHNENNKTRLLNTLYSIWSLSDESNIANHTYTNENPLIFYYNEGGTFRRTFSIEKGEFRFSGGNICERKYIDDEGYTQDKCYNIFQPIRVMYEEGETIKLPSKDIPAFYLMGVHNLENLKARMTSLSFTVDAISLVAAGGGLTKLKDLSKAYKLARVFISGVEIGSTVVDMVLNYTSACDGNSEFCNKLQVYNFWLQMATLSSDIVVSKMAKKAAKEALQVVDATVSDEIIEHLEDVVGSVARNADDITDALRSKLKEVLTSTQADELLADLAANSRLREAMESNIELVESWKKLDDLGFSQVARRNIDNFNQRSIIDEYADNIASATNSRKGNFGEIGADLDLNGKGYESLMSKRIDDIDAAGHNGLDGVYGKNGQYYIVEGKYTGSASLNPANDATGLPRQMSDDWIATRNWDGVNLEQSEIRNLITNKNYQRVLAKVAPDGSVTYRLVDADGYAITGNTGVFNP